MNRRAFLKRTGLAALAPGLAGRAQTAAGILVNDIHSQLNPTRVHEIVRVDSTAAVRQAIRRASSQRRAICVAGGRHAMGAQQFAEDAVMLDTTSLNQVRALDRERGLVEVDAGIMWPELIQQLLKM